MATPSAASRASTAAEAASKAAEAASKAAEAASEAAEAGSKAAESAANAVKSTEALNSKLDHLAEKIFDKLNPLCTNFEVHAEQTLQQEKRFTRLEGTVFGEKSDGSDGDHHKVNVMWTVDRVKVWAVRVVGGACLAGFGATGYAYFKHLAGW